MREKLCCELEFDQWNTFLIKLSRSFGLLDDVCRNDGKDGAYREPDAGDPFRCVEEDDFLHDVDQIVFIRIEDPEVVIKEDVMELREYPGEVYGTHDSDDNGDDGDKGNCLQISFRKKHGSVVLFVMHEYIDDEADEKKGCDNSCAYAFLEEDPAIV